jgi:hypothetical protein
MENSMTESIAGAVIPDSHVVSEATQLVREVASPLLFDHSRRVHLFGMLQGQRRGLKPDPELLYVGAMFHDLGLTEKYRTEHQRFEVDGADEARRFLTSHGISEDAATRVWTAIALHTTPGIPEFMAPEIALVTAGVQTDVLGIATTTSTRPRSGRSPTFIRARTSSGRSRPRSPTASRTGRRPPSAR